MSLDAIAKEVLDGIRARGTYRRMRELDGTQSDFVDQHDLGIGDPFADPVGRRIGKEFEFGE